LIIGVLGFFIKFTIIEFILQRANLELTLERYYSYDAILMCTLILLYSISMYIAVKKQENSNDIIDEVAMKRMMLRLYMSFAIIFLYVFVSITLIFGIILIWGSGIILNIIGMVEIFRYKQNGMKFVILTFALNGLIVIGLIVFGIIFFMQMSKII